jgi:hypothetical protein
LWENHKKILSTSIAFCFVIDKRDQKVVKATTTNIFIPLVFNRVNLWVNYVYYNSVSMSVFHSTTRFHLLIRHIHKGRNVLLFLEGMGDNILQCLRAFKTILVWDSCLLPYECKTQGWLQSGHFKDTTQRKNSDEETPRPLAQCFSTGAMPYFWGATETVKWATKSSPLK